MLRTLKRKTYYRKIKAHRDMSTLNPGKKMANTSIVIAVITLAAGITPILGWTTVFPGMLAFCLACFSFLIAKRNKLPLKRSKIALGITSLTLVLGIFRYYENTYEIRQMGNEIEAVSLQE